VCSSSTKSRIRPSALVTLVEHRLQSLLELTPVLRAGYQRAHVEGEDDLVAQPLGNVTVIDSLGEAFDDGGLADARVADENGVVLRLSGEDLDDTANLAVAPDDGIELARASVGHEVTPVLRERLVGDLRHGRRHPLVAADGGQCLEEPVAAQTLLFQQTSRRRGGALIEEREHEVLDRDILVLETSCLFLCGVQQTAEPLCDEHLTGRGTGARDSRSAFELSNEFGLQTIGVGAGLPEEAGHEPVGLVEQREEEVFAIDFGVSVAQRLGLGVVQGFLRFLRQSVHVHDWPPGVRDGCFRNAASSAATRSSRSTTRARAA